jgi:hypothetical protein
MALYKTSWAMSSETQEHALYRAKLVHETACAISLHPLFSLYTGRFILNTIVYLTGIDLISGLLFKLNYYYPFRIPVP